MAKNRIKGITIEIGGDTTDLQKSLKDVDKSLKNTQDQLKDVNKLLKLDPGNTDLLKQKQELLTKAIQDTATRSRELKKALEEMQKAPNSDKTVEQQNALKREIIETEQNLKSLTNEYKNFGSVAGQKVSQVADKMAAMGTKMTQVGGMLTTRVTLPLIAGFTLAANKASDYEENINKLEVAFGDYADEVRAFTDNAQKDFGLSKVDASANASAFGALAKGIGLSAEQAAEMSIELTKLSADLGSYFNEDVETSAAALEAIFTGNAQSLKKFGVVMTDTNLKEFARDLGMTDKQFAKLTSEDKALLRYQYVIAQTSDAQGDFARTNEGTANTIKTFKSSIQDLATVVGEQLLPIITPMIQDVTEFIQKLGELDEKTVGIITVVGLLVAAIGPVVTMIGNIMKVLAPLLKVLAGVSSTALGIVALVAAIAAALVILYNKSETFRNAVNKLASEIWERVKPILEDLWQICQDGWEILKELGRRAVELWNAFMDTKAGEVFKNTIEKMKDLLLGYIDVVGKVIGLVKDLFGWFKQVLGIEEEVGTNLPRAQNYVTQMQTSGMQSGGFMSGGTLVLNNTFTINNGNQIDQWTVRQWADVLTDRINENLGRMV